MDVYGLVIEEIDTKHNILLQKLSSGSIKDYSEYKYICGIISGLVSIMYLNLQIFFNQTS